MFAIVTESGLQSPLSARQVALTLEGATIVAVTRREAGTVIIASADWQSEDGYSGTTTFAVVAPAPNGLETIYQAGGPLL